MFYFIIILNITRSVVMALVRINLCAVYITTAEGNAAVCFVFIVLLGDRRGGRGEGKSERGGVKVSRVERRRGVKWGGG